MIQQLCFELDSLPQNLTVYPIIPADRIVGILSILPGKSFRIYPDYTVI